MLALATDAEQTKRVVRIELWDAATWQKVATLEGHHAGVLAVAFLATVALGNDDDDALARQPMPSEPPQSLAHIFRERARARQVEAELHRARHLVDILAAGTGCADKAFLDLAVIEKQVTVNRDQHSASRRMAW